MKKPFFVILTALLLIHSIFISAQDSSWIEQLVPFESGTIADLVFVDENRGWAVGQDYSNGRIILLHTENAGEVWVQQTVPDINAYLAKVYMRTDESGYAIGTQYDKAVGLYTMDGGENWEFQHFPESPLFLDAFAFSDDSTGWAGGSGESQALILKMINDSTWVEAFSLETEGAFQAIEFVDPILGWAAGTDWTTPDGEPLLARTIDSGENWEMVELPVHTGFLTDVSFVNQDTGWVVGTSENDFLILETLDGGINWTKIDSLDEHMFGSNTSTFERNPGFRVINGLDFKVDIRFRFAIFHQQKYDRNQGGITVLILIVFTALFLKFEIMTFLAAFILSFFAHTFAIIKDVGPNDLSGPRTEQSLAPGDLVCYAFGAEQGENNDFRPVILKHNIHYSFLNGVSMEPQIIEMIEGDSVDLFVTGVDQYGEEMEVEDPRWTVNGGGSLVIDESGNWFFAEEAGNYVISCKDRFTGMGDSCLVKIDEGVSIDKTMNDFAPVSDFEIIPNPAIRDVQIQFDLKFAGQVQLIIYDQEGKIHHAIDRNMAAGNHSINCVVEELPPGIYYCQIHYLGKKIIRAITVVQ